MSPARAAAPAVVPVRAGASVARMLALPPQGGGLPELVFYIYESSGSYPLRSTVTTNPAATVVWAGPDAPTIGSGYAVNGVDFWTPTST